MRDHEPDHEADEPTDRDGGGRDQRREAQEDAALAADVDAEVGAGLLPQEQAVERPRAGDGHRSDAMSGAAPARRIHDEPSNPPSRNEKIWWSALPERYIAIASPAASSDPTA